MARGTATHCAGERDGALLGALLTNNEGCRILRRGCRIVHLHTCARTVLLLEIARGTITSRSLPTIVLGMSTAVYMLLLLFVDQSCFTLQLRLMHFLLMSLHSMCGFGKMRGSHVAV